MYLSRDQVDNNSGKKECFGSSLLWDMNIAPMMSCVYSDAIIIQWSHVHKYCNIIDASVNHEIMLKNYSLCAKKFAFNIGKIIFILSTDAQFTFLSLRYINKNHWKHFLELSILISFFRFWELEADARIVIEEMAFFSPKWMKIRDVLSLCIELICIVFYSCTIEMRPLREPVNRQANLVPRQVLQARLIEVQ